MGSRNATSEGKRAWADYMRAWRSERLFLEVDHVNGGGAKHYREHTAIAVYNDLIRAGFPSTFQLLCSNCNRGRQRNGGICPHVENAREAFVA